MNITIEERMGNIEQQLQEIKKELEESLNRYKSCQTFPFTNGDISKFRGGQTGMDIAGLVAGCALGIETIGTWPKGLIMRFEDGKDVSMTEEKIKAMVYYGVSELNVD